MHESASHIFLTPPHDRHGYFEGFMPAGESSLIRRNDPKWNGESGNLHYFRKGGRAEQKGELEERAVCHLETNEMKNGAETSCIHTL